MLGFHQHILGAPGFGDEDHPFRQCVRSRSTSAGCDHHPRRRPQHRDGTCQLQAVHDARQLDIGKDQSDITAPVPHHGQSLFRRSATDSIELSLVQQGDCQALCRCVILDHEGEAAGFTNRRGDNGIGLRRGFRLVDLTNEGSQVLRNALGDQVVIEGREGFADLVEGEARRERIVACALFGTSLKGVGERLFDGPFGSSTSSLRFSSSAWCRRVRPQAQRRDSGVSCSHGATRVGPMANRSGKCDCWGAGPTARSAHKCGSARSLHRGVGIGHDARERADIAVASTTSAHHRLELLMNLGHRQARCLAATRVGPRRR